jgi:ubiquinone/menaquinone biosynthesis C-methylase UbiE
VAEDFWKEPTYVPCHGELFGLAGALIPHPREANFSLLDIGSGSGLFVRQLAQNFSNAQFYLLDPSEELLRQAMQRLGPNAPRADAMVLDWVSEDLPGRHDVVSAVLSTHELDGEQKRELYEAIFGVLGRAGLFLLVARVRAGTPSVDQAYRSAWQQQVLAQGGEASRIAGHLSDLKQENLGTVADELAAISASGFVEVNCWYQNLSYALITGVRPI